MGFGENLQAVRRMNHLSQEELAEMLNVSRQAVSKWEVGEGYPEIDKLLLLSKFLNVSLDSLLETGNESAACDSPVKAITVLSPNKEIMLSFRRGVKVDGCTIMAQMENDDWYTLCWYKTPEEAMACMKKIREAMLKGIKYLEL